MSSPSDMIINGVDLDCSQLTFSKPKVTATGGKSVNIINSASKKGLYLTTPLMLTWGMNENDYDGNGKKTYDLSLQFPNPDYETPEQVTFLEKMQAFEQHIFKSATTTHCKEWFNKSKMTEEVAEALFSPMLKYPKDKETGEYDKTRAPTLRVKIPYWEGEFKFELYDMNEQQLFPVSDGADVSPMELLPKASNVALVLQCGGLWFINGKFGVTWKLVQGMVRPRASLRGKCHIRLGASDRAVLEKQAQKEEDEQAQGEGEGTVFQQSADPTAVEDSDDEKPSIAQEVAEEVKPKVVKKKKIVRRKKVAGAE